MPKTTSNKRPLAVITGASSGIGAAFARLLARDGYDLLLVARREELLRNLCQELKDDFAVQADYLVVEMSDRKELERLIKTVRDLPCVDILINNAGFGTRGVFTEVEPKVQESMITVHDTATMLLTRTVLPGMVERGNGGIINVSSIAAFLVGRENALYCASKNFINILSESLALELKGTGVKIQALCPGFTVSDFHAKLGDTPPEKRRWYFMTAEKVAQISLRALRRRKVVCVPGFINRFFRFIIRCLPRWLLYWVSSKRGRTITRSKP